MGKRLLGLLVVSVFTVLAFGGATASAHSWRANTSINIMDDDISGNFIRLEGDLSSPRDRCERGRFVTLWAVDEGPDPDRFTFVDGGVSSFSGEFTVQGDFPAGTDFFVVRAHRQNVGQDGHRHICRAATAALAP